MKAWIGRHPLSAYYLLAYICSWSVAVPLALQGQGLVTLHLPLALHYLTAFGPAIAALIVARLLREPGRRETKPLEGGRGVAWWIVGAMSPLLLFAAAQLVALAAGQ